jgi:pimeloyl-[acyl-carrier protein] methyl ester esterase
MVTIVLLPGMDGTGTLFTDFLSALGKDFEGIIVAYPTDTALDYEGLIEIARARLPIGRPFFLLGESFSGPIAISLAAEKPEGLLGLILSCTFAKNPLSYFKPLKSLTRILPMGSGFTGLISPFLLGRFSTKERRVKLREALSNVSSDALRSRLRAVLEVDYSSKLSNLAVPILYLRATEDRVVFRSASQYILKCVPTATVVSLHGPHLLLQTDPIGAANAVKEFVRQVSNAKHIGDRK